MFPFANTDIGPGCLALFLGSEPEFREDTVWMHPCMDVDSQERLPPVRLDPGNRWWKLHQETIEETLTLSRGKYLVGLPDLYGGLDVLGLMRRIENFMMELILDIEDIDAIEWTPDPRGPNGDSPEWYDLYRRILDAGKAVQPINVWPDEVVPLLDAIGAKGVYALGLFGSEAEVEQVLRDVEPYR